jgi:cytoskeleton protein RodZ
MKSVGEKLRRERIERNIDLETLAQMTRINQRYLEAIETGKSENLPGGFFYRSFVRQYALALGLDTDEIESELERVREAEAPVLSAALQHTEFPVKQPDPIVTEGNRRFTGGRLWGSVVLLAAVLIGCSAFYAWWYRHSNQSQEVVAAAEPHPAGTQPSSTTVHSEPSQQAQSSANGSTATAAPGPGVTPPTAVQTPIGVPVKPTTDNTGAATQPAANQPLPAPAVAVPGPDDKVVLNLTASESVWISVTADGKTVFSGIMNPNETKTLAGKSSALVRVGNAGGLAITWNGKSIGPLGPKGQVRTVVLTPESYKINVPTPPAAVPEREPSGLL